MTDTPTVDKLARRAEDFGRLAQRVRDPALRKQFRELNRRFVQHAEAARAESLAA